MAEMLLFIAGIYTLVFGKIHLPWNLSSTGWRARFAAVFLIIPLPAALILGRQAGNGLPGDDAVSFFGLFELMLVVFGLAGALIFTYVTKKDATDKLN